MRAPLDSCLSVWHLLPVCLTRRDCRHVPLPELGWPFLVILHQPGANRGLRGLPGPERVRVLVNGRLVNSRDKRQAPRSHKAKRPLSVGVYCQR